MALGFKGFSEGAMTGLSAGLGLGIIGVLTFQFTGTNWILWAATRPAAGLGMRGVQ